MLHIDNLSKKFNETPVFNDISFNIKQGEIVALIGPSGTGKSTLMRCLNFLEKADSGHITLDGYKVDTDKASKLDIAYLRKHTSMVFQHYNLFKNKTVLGNVTEALTTVHKTPAREAKELALQCLEKVEMLDKQNAYPSRLSGGQQQRVGIARAMAVKPKLLLFDEPTSSLDPELVDEVLKVIKSLAEQKHTMLLVTHELAFARDVANQVIFLNEGGIYEQNNAKDFFANPQKERTRQFIRSLGNSA